MEQSVEPVDVPVVIIGGGGCGLNLSIFLSDKNVGHVLFEKHDGTSLLPKAHYLNQRSMEIFRLHGYSDRIRTRGAPVRNISQVTFSTSLGGTGPFDRKLLARCDSFGGHDDSELLHKYLRVAPERPTNLPLIRSEPIWRGVAEERNPGNIRFSHKVIDVIPSDDNVIVKVQCPDGKESVYRAQYVVAAEGGKGIVGPKVGIKMEGPTNIVDVVSVHFEADLSEYWDDRTLIANYINPDGETLLGSGTLVQMGPTWGRHSEEFSLHFGFRVDDPARFSEDNADAMVPRIRELLKIPNLEIKVRKVSHWVLERVLADKYRVGRVFVAGDAAHRRPPTTGLGLNTSIEDAHNLAWKLAQVVHGQASPSLLDTYEQERRLIGKRNCDWGLMTFMNTGVLNAALGFIPGQKEANAARMASLTEDTDSGATFRAILKEIFKTQRTEYSALDLELGFSYWNGGAQVPDGTRRPPVDPMGQDYEQTTRPGHRLPHIWLDNNEARSSHKISTHDIIRPEDDYLLITDQYGAAWISAAASASKSFGIQIATAQIGPAESGLRPCKYIDRDDRWAAESKLWKGGAVLVRPDNFTAWRSVAATKSQGQELIAAVKTLLSDKVGNEIPLDPYAADREPLNVTQNKDMANGTTEHANGVKTDEDFISSAATTKMKLVNTVFGGSRATAGGAADVTTR